LDGFLAEARARVHNASRAQIHDDQYLADMARAMLANEILNHFTQIPEEPPAPDHALQPETRENECPANQPD
jgi:hypothetical protein